MRRTNIKSPLYIFNIWKGETWVGAVALYFCADATVTAIEKTSKTDVKLIEGDGVKTEETPFFVGYKFTRTGKYTEFPWVCVYQPFSNAPSTFYTLDCSKNEARLVGNNGLEITFRDVLLR